MAVSASDQRVCQDVYEVLCHDVRLDTTNLSVRVQNGIVHLTGTVPHYIQKAVATQLVERIRGVRGVQNDLQVVLTRLVTDSEIAAAVRGHLQRDARFDRPEQIRVRVAHGVVTLDGSAASHAQVLAAYEDAWSAPGVVDVKSTVFVHPPKRPDPRIADDVRSALAATHPSTTRTSGCTPRTERCFCAAQSPATTRSNRPWPRLGVCQASLASITASPSPRCWIMKHRRNVGTVSGANHTAEASR